MEVGIDYRVEKRQERFQRVVSRGGHFAADPLQRAAGNGSERIGEPPRARHETHHGAIRTYRIQPNAKRRASGHGIVGVPAPAEDCRKESLNTATLLSNFLLRSEERRVGNDCVCTFRFRWWLYH